LSVWLRLNAEGDVVGVFLSRRRFPSSLAPNRFVSPQAAAEAIRAVEEDLSVAMTAGTGIEDMRAAEGLGLMGVRESVGGEANVELSADDLKELAGYVPRAAGPGSGA
jgi:hypothetical protein